MSSAPGRTPAHASIGGRALRRRARPALLFLVKLVHSLAFWVIQSAIFYLLYKGIRRQTDRGALLAAAIATGESFIYAANGFRCPLTTLAEDLGAERGSVTDIFLPSWLASNIARIYGPMFGLGLFLHARNILSARKRATVADTDRATARDGSRADSPFLTLPGARDDGRMGRGA